MEWQLICSEPADCNGLHAMEEPWTESRAVEMLEKHL